MAAAATAGEPGTTEHLPRGLAHTAQLSDNSEIPEPEAELAGATFDLSSAP